MPTTYSDVATEHLRACLAQAYDEFKRRWGVSSGTSSLVAHMAKILFEQRTKELDAGKRTASVLRLRGLLEEMQRTRSLSEKSFHGNKRQQTVLAKRLRKLKPYELHDGRVLTLIGPEHTVDGEVHLYLDFAVAAPQQAASVGESDIPPDDEHAARARRLATAIAQFFERLLLRRSPTEVEQIEKTAKRRGLRYALIAIFFPIACAGVYYYVSNQLEVHAVAIAPRHLNKSYMPRPRTLFDVPTLTVVRWTEDGPIRPPYEVYKNGTLVAKTSSPYFLDGHPNRDRTPGVERIIDQYRVVGRLWGFVPRVTPRIPTDDRVQPNSPCLVGDEAQLCVPTYALDTMLKMPLSEFAVPPVRIAVVGEENTVNLTPVVVETPGTAVNPRAEGAAETRIVPDGKISKAGDTTPMKQVFTDTGLYDLRLTEADRSSSIQKYTVITKEQLRNRAILNQKLNSYGDPHVFALTVMDAPVTLPDLPPGAPTPPFPVNVQDRPLARPQILCSRLPGSDTVMISVCPTGCKPGECEVEMDYDYLQMTLEPMPGEAAAIKETKSGLVLWLFSRDYTLQPGEPYYDHEFISAWVYRVEKGQRTLAQVIRKKVTLPGRRVGAPATVTITPPGPKKQIILMETPK
jgi:hypothetical protein